MKKIGIFGGTFDPFHNGHSTILRCFVEQCKLDKCFVVPTKCSPFKVTEDKLYSDIERIDIIEKNIESIPYVELCCYEIDSTEEVSYSVDTVKYFYNIYSNVELFLLLGYDAVLKFNKWKDYKEILAIAKLVVARRGHFDTVEVEEQKLTNVLGIGKCILLNNPIIDITSTKIRTDIKNGNFG